ncbi:MAG TPA: hypothetical protein VMZ33_07090 [Candidatus Limnocylindrales bacterium]|nr:hypothetical protein [Candidatus Limnocylindrales bacterium]
MTLRFQNALRSKLALAIAIAMLALPAINANAPVRAAVNSLGLRATYDVDATFNWATRAVSVRTAARVTNPGGSSVSTAAFNVVPLRQGNANLGAVTVNGSYAPAQADDQTVLVTMSPALGPGDSATVVINYTATLNSTATGEQWLFARADGVMAAYRWIPWLARETRYNRPSVGDPWATDISSSVTVDITTDRVLKFASTGRRISSSNGGLTQHFTAASVRDFNFTAAPDYVTRTRWANNTKITFYYRTMNATNVLNVAAGALTQFASKLGSAPYSTLNIGEVGPSSRWGAIESPGHFWLPRGGSASIVNWEVAHEVAHEWFYASVGNDQAYEPFADEAVADFLARDYLNQWASSQCAQNDLDHTVYSIGNCYPWVIYVQGNLYLKKYRADVGSTDFWQGLRNYYQNNKFGFGGTRELLLTLDNAAGVNYNHEARFPSLF